MSRDQRKYKEQDKQKRHSKPPKLSRTVAHFPGWCTDCGGPIREGEPIKRESKEDAWVHDNCDLAVYLREEV